MKKILLNALIFGVLVFVIACNKSVNSAKSQLNGKWEIRHVFGGMLGFDSLYAVGNGNTISFTKGDFEKQQNGSIAETGSYTLSKENGVKTINFLGTSTVYSSTYKISNDSLYLDINAPASDGLASIYVKVSQ